MRFNKLLGLYMGAALAVAWLVASCGKSEDTESEKKAGQELLDMTKRAADQFTIEEEASHIQQMIEAAGFEARSYVKFPAQELGKKGRMLIYASKRGKSGGVIYIKKTGNQVAPVWHWYFEDMVPETVDKLEMNGDGLWDIEVVSKDGKRAHYIQDDSFALTARERSDWIALNGASSPPTAAENAVWRCFDSDTSTAWRSSLGEGNAFIELHAPFGVESGILTVQTLAFEQPRGCTLYADGKKIQEFELNQAAARQMIHLESGVQGAKRVRLEFDSAYGAGGAVAVAELALK